MDSSNSWAHAQMRLQISLEGGMTYRGKAERAVEIAEVLGGTFLTMVLVEGLFKLFI